MKKAPKGKYSWSVTVGEKGQIVNSFHITLHRRDRRLQIVGNIADQLLALPVKGLFLLIQLLQTESDRKSVV